MKQITLLILLTSFFGINSFAQKITGFGGELSILSLKPNFRMWTTKTTGFEIFAGPASHLEDFVPDDMEAGFKYLHALIYKRTERTYIGVVGKWKWAKGNDPSYKTNLPVGGILIGKEWYDKRVKRKGWAVELGYQYGVKEYNIYTPKQHVPIGKDTFEEFPLILNLRYSFYTKR